VKRIAWLLLLPFASGALFAQGAYTMAGNVPANGTVGVSYSASLTTSPQAYAAWSYTGSLPPGLSMTTGNSYAAAISGTPTVAGSYTFTVQASLGTNPNSAPILVKQTYTVVIAAAAPPPVYITPTSLPNGTYGTAYSQVLTASGGYGAGTYTFSIDPSSPGSLPPGLTITTAGSIGGTPVQAGTFIFSVRLTSQTANGASVSVSQGYTITIAGPLLSITNTSLPGGTIGVLYSQALAATGGTAPYTWQVTTGSLPGGLSLQPATGNIYGTPTAAGSSSFQVKVTDSQQGSATGSFTIRITAAPLAITTTSLPGATVGTSYTAILAAAGGTVPYTWSVASGALPGGLSISSAGVISGTPTATGTFSVTLKVTDSAQATATQAYSVTVAAAVVALSITTPSPLPGGEVGVAYTLTFAATGGTTPYNWELSSGAIPAGLALGGLTGSLTGTPTTAGTFTFTLLVVDSTEKTAPKTFTISVTAAVKIITAPAMPDGITGTLYAQQFLASGGLAPYAWSIASGSIPAGLSLNTANGQLSGTPTAPGTYTFTIGVTDQNGQKDSAPYTIRIVAPLSITAQTPLPGGVVGAAYTQAFAATGGAAPYQWIVSTGSLPTGLSLNSATGSLSGTPTAAGTFNFTLQVVDAAGRSATASFTIVVTAGLTITTATLPNATVGTAYSQTLALAGGTGTFTWSVSTGALPGGITLNSATGSLTGTPTAAGTFNFTLQVVDAAGRSATASFTIAVTAGLTITTASPLPGATVSIAYNQALALAGGAAPFTWSIASGALPAGIALNPGSLNGIPSAPGTFTFTVSVTGGGQTATKSFTLTVGMPPGPNATLTGLPATASPATQPALGITIPSAYPLAITGTVTLTFVPDSPSPDGQEVVFTTGGRTVGFTVAASSTQVAFSGATPAVQTGTVSGTITLTLKLTAAGIDITPSPAPSTKLTVAKAAPVIKTATVTHTSGGFNLVVVGYATSREMVSANVGFVAVTGVTLASSQATVSLSPVFTTWYADPTSAPYGSNFSLTIPFTFSSSTSPVSAVSVQLTNSQGSSNSVSATY
jgi:hypothetical protein